MTKLFQPQPYKVTESNHSMVIARSQVDDDLYQKYIILQQIPQTTQFPFDDTTN